MAILLMLLIPVAMAAALACIVLTVGVVMASLSALVMTAYRKVTHQPDPYDEAVRRSLEEHRMPRIFCVSCGKRFNSESELFCTECGEKRRFEIWD